MHWFMAFVALTRGTFRCIYANFWIMHIGLSWNGIEVLSEKAFLRCFNYIGRQFGQLGQFYHLLKSFLAWSEIRHQFCFPTQCCAGRPWTQHGQRNFFIFDDPKKLFPSQLEWFMLNGLTKCFEKLSFIMFHVYLWMLQI